MLQKIVQLLKIIVFSSGQEFFAFIEKFYCLKSFSELYKQQMIVFFKNLIRKRSAMVYIDNKLLTSNSSHICCNMKNNFEI